MPNNVTHVVFGESTRSKALAEIATAELRQRFKHDVAPVQLARLVEGAESLSDADDNSVLIVCDEESSGEQLLSASRALRPYERLFRHYLVGWCFPETRASHQRLMVNLRASPREDRKFGWSNFHNTPVGAAGLHSSWRTEANLFTTETVASFRIQNKPLNESLARRASLLVQTELRGGQLFLPKFDGGVLSLQHGSVFLGEADLSHVAVYISVAGALQRARDGKDEDEKPLPSDQCFDNSPFIDTVLDPDMFSRFNDGVIQAAFLRACSVDELNYSRSRALSRHMAGIIKSALSNRRGANGEAALEFLFALSTHKLRLEEVDRDVLLSLIKNDPELREVWALFEFSPAF